jgi:PHD/YefM family antitoxin component YafN of YafNO toxin-antitoxin module
MRRINALTVRNKLGEVLDMLDAEHEPIMISKGKKLRAVLISYEDFIHRFIDKQAEEEKEAFIKQAERWRAQAGDKSVDPVDALRALRGYEE